MFSIKLKGSWIRSTFSPSITSIVPNEAVNLFIKKIFEIVSMWVVDHMLISHGIWITQNKSIVFQVPLTFIFNVTSIKLVLQETVLLLPHEVARFFCGCKKHGIDINFTCFLVEFRIIFALQRNNLFSFKT